MVGPSDYVDLYRMFPHMARKINERRADLLEPVQTDEVAGGVDSRASLLTKKTDFFQ